MNVAFIELQTQLSRELYKEYSNKNYQNIFMVYFMQDL